MNIAESDICNELSTVFIIDNLFPYSKLFIRQCEGLKMASLLGLYRALHLLRAALHQFYTYNSTVEMLLKSFQFIMAISIFRHQIIFTQSAFAILQSPRPFSKIDSLNPPIKTIPVVKQKPQTLILKEFPISQGFTIRKKNSQ